MPRWLIIVGLLLSGSAHAVTPQQQALLFASGGPSLGCNFLSGNSATQTAGSIVIGPKCPTITAARASSENTATYLDAAGASWTTCASNVPCFTPGKGLGSWTVATNYLLNSETPATQTTGSLSVGTYVFFCNGTGSVLTAAATAVGSGFGTIPCSQGTYQTIVITTLGSVVLTVTGTVNWFDLQNSPNPTPHITTAGATVTRAADNYSVSVGSWYNSLAGTLVTTLISANPVTPNPSAYEWASFGTGTTNSLTNRFQFGAAFSPQIQSFVGNASQGVAAATAVATANVSFSTSFTYNKVTGLVQNVALGASPVSVSMASLPSATTFQMGGGGVGRSGNCDCYLQSYYYWPKVLQTAQLLKVTP